MTKLINPEEVADQFRSKIDQGASTSEDQFQDVFDPSPSAETSYNRGNWDFSVHIANPVARFISSPEKMTALELGYGGGRVLAAASRFFQKVYGVDIHEQSAKVSKELSKRGIDNFELLTSQGSNIALPDRSVDLAYSFIVIQHFGKVEVFKNYMKELSRVLKPGGVAVLYFGRFSRFSFNRGEKWRLLFDRVGQYIALPKGYVEIAVKSPTDNSLLLTGRFVRETLKDFGFSILEDLVSRRKVPDGFDQFGGQFGVIVRKESKAQETRD